MGKGKSGKERKRIGKREMGEEGKMKREKEKEGGVFVGIGS